MPRPCNCCSLSGKKCVISSETARHCSECVRSGRSCSFMTSDLDWNKLVVAVNHIEHEEAETRARVSELFTQLNHLEKQKKLLHSHAGKFLQSDMTTVEELEKEEQEEKEKHEKALNDQLLLSREMDDLFNVSFGSLGPEAIALLDPPLSHPLDDTSLPAATHL
ncbi:hypothetical protein I7I53_10964 [Histoplasma capsulatum var. duboisii H88]|uniref:Zn(2)-C6 fungal-type domain-containing protein n=1 Tax=Ajellomyces capsulatus (strain H88) TaxID=544711 RepID=A0A8A1L883_AJEC8|nr:hypothetical protein I7I53_10964 [Histoplasma capsulatum var. duboisii H88]